MATMFNMVSLALSHAAEFGCEPVEEWIPLSSWAMCPVRSTDECYENHSHARQCDECGTDMVLTVASCAHMMVRTHRCPNDGFTKRYAGQPAE